MSEQKLCKDCKWCKPFVRSDKSIMFDIAECKNPQGFTVSLVDGTLKCIDMEFCETHREKDWGEKFAACGKSGKWFEPKDEASLIAELKADLESEIKRPWWKVW